MIALVHCPTKLGRMSPNRALMLLMILIALVLTGCRDEPSGKVRKFCIQNRTHNHAAVSIEYDGRLARVENCPRAVNLIGDFDKDGTDVRVPLTARFHVAVQPPKDSNEAPESRFTQLKVRREIPTPRTTRSSTSSSSPT